MKSRVLAFTLIELMLVIVIVGILATVAIPSYGDYVYNTKVAEGLVSMGAIRQEQIAYFYDHEYFPYFYNANHEGPSYVPGAKSKLIIEGSSDSPTEIISGVPIHPLPEDSWNYFRYSAYGFYWDKDGNIGGSNGGISFELLAGYQGTEDEVACIRTPGFGMEDWGITAAPSRHIAFNVAHAVLKSKNDFREMPSGAFNGCTALVQILTADGEGIRSTPIIILRE